MRPPVERPRSPGIAWSARGLIALVAAASLAGCAVGPVGALLGKVTPAAGGWVLETYAVGGHVLVSAGDRGLDLGVARRVYVFAERDVPAPASGWYPLLLPRAPLDAAMVRHAETLGVAVRLAAPAPGVTVGFHGLLAGRAPAGAEGGFVDVRFEPDAPSRTCVSTRQEVRC